MNKKISFMGTVAHIFLVVAVFFTIFAFKSLYEGTKSVSVLTLDRATLTIAGVSYQVDLPYKINVLPDRTPVTLTVEVPTAPLKNSIYVRTDLSPFTVSVGGEEIYSYGHDGERPSFMADPANHSVMLTDVNLITDTTLTIEYLSPATQNSMLISPIYLGSQSDVFQHLTNQMGPILICCIILLSLGALLVVGALMLSSIEVNGSALVWVGLFYTSTGLWILGECDLSSLFFFTPTTLYLMARLGMFLCPVAMLCFSTALMQMRQARILTGIAIGFGGLTLSSLLCQLLGLVQMAQFTTLYNWALFLSMAYLFINLITEWRARNQKVAVRLLLPVAITCCFGGLQVLDLAWRPIQPYIHLIQVGATVLTATVLLVTITLSYTKSALILRGRQNFQLELLSYQVEEQNRHRQQMAVNAQKIRAQSHDLRHQLAVIRRLNQEGHREELADYLDNLVEDIPNTPTPYCENIAVNAVLSHYASQAQQAGIAIDIGLSVPAQSPLVRDDELTVIFGNLLENAVEACLRLPQSQPSITLRGEYRYGVLSVVMSNSYDGFWEQPRGKVRSHKRKGFGVGLTSIEQVAHLHNGQVKFWGADKGVFHSSVYLTLGEMASHATPASTR